MAVLHITGEADCVLLVDAVREGDKEGDAVTVLHAEGESDRVVEVEEVALMVRALIEERAEAEAEGRRESVGARDQDTLAALLPVTEGLTVGLGLLVP